MAKKTFADFVILMDKFYLKKKLPNGKSVSRENVAQYFAKEYKGEYNNQKDQRKGLDVGGFRKLYTLWFRGIAPSIRIRPEIERPVKELKSINLIDDIDLGIPDGGTNFIAPYVIKGAVKIGILADIHLPYHDLPVLKAAIKHLQKENIDVLLLNGDIFDFYKCSRYQQIPNKPSLKAELEMGRVFLRQLRQLFPTQKILFKDGNHENRLENYIINQAPALYGVESLTLSQLLEFNDLNIIHIKSHQLIQAGNLSILHGHEINAGGVNLARSIYMKVGCSALVAHNHKTSEVRFKTVQGNWHEVYTIGCLCDLYPDYAIFNQMNNGFAVVKVAADGGFKVDNLRTERVDGGVRLG
mgnify:CR=1 FL=1